MARLGQLHEFGLHVLELAREQPGDRDHGVDFTGPPAQQVARFEELGGGVLRSVRKSATLAGFTGEPSSTRTAASISHGRTIAAATWQRLASWRPSIAWELVKSGSSSEWSISPASCSYGAGGEAEAPAA